MGKNFPFGEISGMTVRSKPRPLYPTLPQQKRRGDCRPHRVDQVRTDQIGKLLELLSAEGESILDGRARIAATWSPHSFSPPDPLSRARPSPSGAARAPNARLRGGLRHCRSRGTFCPTFLRAEAFRVREIGYFNRMTVGLDTGVRCVIEPSRAS